MHKGLGESSEKLGMCLGLVGSLAGIHAKQSSLASAFLVYIHNMKLASGAHNNIF